MALNLEKMRGELNRLEGKNMGSAKYVRLPKDEGFVVIRFLPPRDGSDMIYCSYRYHFINNRSVTCLRKMDGQYWNGDCPICTHYSSMWKNILLLVVV